MSAPLALLDALALVPDPRGRQGRFHPLVAVLGLTVVALLAGCKSFDAIAQFGRDRSLIFFNQPFARMFSLTADFLADRPEVHFELRKGRTPIDPQTQLPRR